ncbi:MAG TPA: zinc ABC transporter substrate-binding protein [Candidatus Hydrogenedentes bacterium]|nr:zinc ABC transporter substrate-binding protein [Candidatus Hydrogenedentota bacterium]HIJ72493.1 zinc ABC transporter substrate-binding protein [Candidatus Hydrogenedentota bacterium]
MRIATFFLIIALVGGLSQTVLADASERDDAQVRLNVVATLPDYAMFARAIGGPRVSVSCIVRGDQDAHFIRPKPSFVNMVKDADLLIATGLDLELWLPTVVDKSGNKRVRSGQPGYVAAAQGMRLLEKPGAVTRAEGGVHIYGNPHVTCSPIQMKVAARNIAAGLIKNDPAGETLYRENLTALLDAIDRRLFGNDLVELLGGEVLCDLVEKDALMPFLEEHELEGRPLVELLGGWTGRMLPFRGTAVVTYHKNWIYFLKLFGIEEAGTVEPKPGIPPSPRHVSALVESMRSRGINIILAANYFDEHKIRTVAGRVGAQAVIVPLYVGGTSEVKDYFQLVDLWVDQLLDAAKANEGTTKTSEAEA